MHNVCTFDSNAVDRAGGLRAFEFHLVYPRKCIREEEWIYVDEEIDRGGSLGSYRLALNLYFLREMSREMNWMIFLA